MTTQKKKHVVKRNTSPNVSLSKYMLNHSPVKAGVDVEDSDLKAVEFNKICEHVYLGNYKAAKSKDFFEKRKIKAVLNCTIDLKNTFRNSNIEYMRIPVEDSLKMKDINLMTLYMPCIAEYIHKHADIQKHNIFVHCHMGRERSVAAVVAYLMKFKSMTPHSASKLVMDKRPEAFFYGKSVNFEKSINAFYKTLKSK